MEQNTFTHRGRVFTITLGGINAADTIKVEYPNDPNLYLDTLGDIALVSKRDKKVEIVYSEYASNLAGFTMFSNGAVPFSATSQETFGYFYDMIVGNSKLGTTLDKMIIDGLLIHKYGLQQGVYGTDGKFYYPIDFDFTVTHTTTSGVDATGAIVETTTGSISIVVSDKVVGEVYTYSILGTTLSNTTGNFTGVPLGSYTILVESPKSMPCYYPVTV